MDRIYDVCFKIAEIFKVYVPDWKEPCKNAQAAENVIRSCQEEIEGKARELLEIEEVEGDTSITLARAIEEGLLDFSGFECRLIPQHTDGTRFNRDTFIFNALAEALSAAMVNALRKSPENTEYRFGIARETSELAAKAREAHQEYRFTGLDEYLSVIFPGEKWIHDKAFGHGLRIRPDYRCERLKLIVEFDGTPHYTDPKVMERDRKNQDTYEDWGYRVVRIPYFVQLTREVIQELFGVDVGCDLVDPEIPSMGKEWENTPAYCCTAGVARMASDFDRFPQQFGVNLEHLVKQGDNNVTGASILKWFMVPENRYVGVNV